MSLKEPLAITALSSLSSLGNATEVVWNAYLNNDHYLHKIKTRKETLWAGVISEDIKNQLEALRTSDAKYQKLDNTVIYSIATAREAIAQAGWENGDIFGINIGSSRGATTLFEKYHQEFLEQDESSTLASPTTTLGNISSWVSHDLGSKGPQISHSITCSTALHSILNGVAWLQSGMSNKFLVGGSEAAVTPFTIAQMQALKVYSKLDGEYPSRALDFKKRQNTMVLGEGAAMVCLETDKPNNTLATIIGVGYATELLQHNVSISADARCFQHSMKMALGQYSSKTVNAIVMHAPGTVKGDIAEYSAIEKVFGDRLPFLTTNKWKMGHTFGASGMLSLELAVLMLQYQVGISTPFYLNESIPTQFDRIMVNAVGFGGNAVSILLERP
ncbi:MAG: beta-ketoacyl synthase [Croceitalea sp.]|nr:beta-ketoacyl synthase [Croceitalea sp.]